MELLAKLEFVWILASAGIAVYLIAKYERTQNRGSRNSEQEEGDDNAELYDDDGWKPSLRCIYPAWFLVFRLIGFILLFVLIIYYAMARGGQIFYSYERFYWPKGTKGVRDYPQVAGFWTRTFQIIFQMQAGAVVFAVCVFWGFKISRLAHKNSSMDRLIDASVHLVNLVLVLIETALNSLRFPWFRIVYFILWTSVFVVFQSTVHAFVALWWPYFFLDLSSPYSPLWNLLVAVSHVPCYGLFILAIKLKHFIFLKCVPTSNQRT